MITQELNDETKRFIQSLRKQEVDHIDRLEKAKQIYTDTLHDLGYSESYIKENVKRIEQRLQQNSTTVQAPLLSLEEKEVDIWLVEALKKRLLFYLINQKKLETANALYIVAQYVSLDGRDMIHKFAHSSPDTREKQ